MAVEEWSAQEFDRALRTRERILVLYEGSRAAPIRKLFHSAEPEGPVPFARVFLPRADPRRALYHIQRLPTLVYYEHGEELERVDGLPRYGITRRDLDELLATIEHIQEEPRLPRRMFGPRRST